MLNYPRYSETSKTGVSVPGPGLLPLLNVWGPVADKWSDWNSNAQHASEEIMQSWLKFISDRVAKDVALPEQLAACKTVNDLYVVYSQFWQQTAKDYALEYNVIANAILGTMNSAIEATGSGSKLSRH